MRTGTDIEALIAKAQTARLLYQALEAKAYDYLLKYSPDQPRVPRGNSGGGQWMSENGLTYLKRIEGSFKPQAYRDQAEYWTIGYGHKLKHGESFPYGITEEEAHKLLQNDLRTAENTVKKYVKVSLEQNQFDAVVSLTYNVGPKVFRMETYKGSGVYKNTELLNLLNAGDYNGSANQILKFNKITAKDGTVSTSPGLARRRKEEHDIFLHASYPK